MYMQYHKVTFRSSKFLLDYLQTIINCQCMSPFSGYPTKHEVNQLVESCEQVFIFIFFIQNEIVLLTG